MGVEEEGEIDAIITKEDIAQLKAKLGQLEKIKARRDTIIKESGAKQTPGERAEQKQISKEIKEIKKSLKETEKKAKEQEKKRKEQDTKFKNFLGKLGRFGSDPRAFVAETVFDVAKDNRWIPIIGAVVGLGLAIFKLIEREFGDGGIFDLRKKVYDIVRSIVGLKNLIDVESGEIYMSASTRITQLPPETGNTESLRDGHVRFNQLTLGYI